VKKRHRLETDHEKKNLSLNVFACVSQQVVNNRGQYCEDIELGGYLANAADPVPLVLDLRIVHDRFGSSSNPDLNGKLH
jgi:hypothetical protein